jgi:hypothetical protein
MVEGTGPVLSPRSGMTSERHSISRTLIDEPALRHLVEPTSSTFAETDAGPQVLIRSRRRNAANPIAAAAAPMSATTATAAQSVGVAGAAAT